MEMQNLTLMEAQVAGPSPLLAGNHISEYSNASYWSTTLPSNFTPVGTGEPMGPFVCGEDIRTMNLSTYAYPTHRTKIWVPFGWRELLKVVAYIVLFLVSLTGNVLVILVVYYNVNMRSSTYQYLVNLAVADLLVTLVTMWVHLVRHLSYPHYVLPAFICKLDSFVQTVTMLASVLTLTVISVGRFVAVIFPLHAHTSPNHAHRAIATIWLLSFIIASPILRYRERITIQWSDFTSVQCEELWPTTTQFDAQKGICVKTFDGKKLFYSVLIVLLYFIPVVIMVTSYSMVVWTMWRTQLPGEQSAPCRNTAVRAKKRVVKMVSVVLLVFVICWTPLQTLLLYSTIYDGFVEWNVSNTLEFMVYFLSFTNSALNPIIYCGFNTSFRQGVISLLTCRHGSTDRFYHRGTRRGMTGGTRETTLGSGPEPAVLLEIGSLKVKGKLPGRWSGVSMQHGWNVSGERDGTRHAARTQHDQPQHPDCKRHTRSQEEEDQSGPASAALGPHNHAAPSTQLAAQNGGGYKRNSQTDHASRKLSTQSSSYGSNDGGSGCGCYLGKQRKRKDVSVYQEKQIYDDLRDKITKKAKEEMV